jgi:hypothetical protein
VQGIFSSFVISSIYVPQIQTCKLSISLGACFFEILLLAS